MSQENPQVYNILRVSAIIGIVVKFMQILKVGPWYIRWYLSDLVFPLGVALVVKWYFNTTISQSILISCAIAIAYECVQFLIHKGDVIDIALYIIGTVIGLAYIKLVTK